jgi:hypothetical protein
LKNLTLGKGHVLNSQTLPTRWCLPFLIQEESVTTRALGKGASQAQWAGQLRPKARDSKVAQGEGTGRRGKGGMLKAPAPGEVPKGLGVAHGRSKWAGLTYIG